MLSIEVITAIATLVLISVGLAVIFGMMKIINLGHGELMMLGAYAAIFISALTYSACPSGCRC